MTLKQQNQHHDDYFTRGEEKKDDGDGVLEEEENDDGDDEMVELLGNTNWGKSDHPLSATMRVEKTAQQPEFTFSLQPLAWIVLALLLPSRVLLWHECREAVNIQTKYYSSGIDGLPGTTPPPFLREYQLRPKLKPKYIFTTGRERQTSTGIWEIWPNETILVDEYHTLDLTGHYRFDENMFALYDVLRVVKPKLGYVYQYKNKGSYGRKSPYFLPTSSTSSSAKRKTSSCPLILSGWHNTKNSAYLYAPTWLVVAQQLWNAAQVMVLFFLMAINFVYSRCYYQGTTQPTALYPDVLVPTQYGIRIICVRIASVIEVLFLPFSIYVNSPASTFFSFIAFCLIVLALAFTPWSTVVVSMGTQKDNESPEQEATMVNICNQFKPARIMDARAKSDGAYWTLIPREETFGFLCTLGSSLYNLGANGSIWPYWRTQWRKIDRFMDWDRSGDLTPEELWNIFGLVDDSRPSTILPEFVPRGGYGTTTGQHIFTIVWSVLPFLYISYFCLALLNTRTDVHSTPVKWIQRFMCIFGICHFLFGTDVVCYKYGRGFRNPHQEIFHWIEKWSWRFAIYVPLWQNVASGHWYHGHKYVPFLGKLVHYLAMIWGILFFIFQTINADVFRTYEYAMDYETASLITLLGIDKNYKFIDMRKLRYPYFRGLVCLWTFYALLHILGFTLYKIYLQPPKATPPLSSYNRSRSKPSLEQDQSKVGLEVGGFVDDEIQEQEHEGLLTTNIE